MKSLKHYSAPEEATYPHFSLQSSSISPHKFPRTDFILSKALLPSKQRMMKVRATSHNLKFDFSNLHSSAELSKLHLMNAFKHIKSLPFSFAKLSNVSELSISIISDRWQLNYRKSLTTLFKALLKFKFISKLNLSFYNTFALDKLQFQNLSSVLKCLKKLKSCNIKLNGCPNVGYDKVPGLLLPLKYLPLKEISISFFGDALQTAKKVKQGHKTLLKTLSKLRQCRRLSMELDLNTSLNDSDFNELAVQISRMTSLQCLRLKLGTRNRPNLAVSTVENVTNDGLLFLFGCLNSLSYLNELSVHLIDCKSISEEGILNCMQYFSQSRHFKTLSYKFEGFTMNNPQRMLSLVDPLSKLTDPKNIKLRVQASPDFTACYTKQTETGNNNKMQETPLNGEIQLSCDIPPALHWNDYHIYAKAFSGLPNMKTFYFTCRDNAYTWELAKQTPIVKYSPINNVPILTNGLLHLLLSIDESMRAAQTVSILGILGRLIHIEGISLNFTYCTAVPEEALTQIMSLLPSLSNLKHLAVKFVTCPNATDDVINVLSRSLVHFQQLENLSFQLESCQAITNTGILSLFAAIKKISLLKNLNLNLQDCSLITLLSFQQLPRALEGLIGLEGLCLVLPGIPQTSNTELQHLGSYICHLKELRNLHLNFSNCEEISDEGLYAIGESLMKIKGIKYLEIHLDNCWKLGNEGVCQVGKFIKVLKELHSLKISLKGCKNITAEGVNQLMSEICEIENLQFLTLDFGIGVGEEMMFHKADVFLKFERMENISVNLKASREMIIQRVQDLRKKLGEVRQVIIFFK